MTNVILLLFCAFGMYFIWWQIKYSRNLKPLRYADHYNSLRVSDWADPSIPPLSEEEVEVYQLLQKASPDTIWGAAIHYVIREQDINRFRELVCQLKSQAGDQPSTMEKIIGAEALNKIMSL